MESFAVLTELAIAIAGFSGITIAIHGRARVTDPVTVFRNKNLITWSLGAAFGSLLPDAVSKFGAVGPEVWAWSGLLYCPFVLYLIVSPFVARASLSKADRARLSRAIWFFGIAGGTLLTVALIANAVGWVGEPSPAPIYVGVLWTILLAAIQFFRLLFSPSPSSDA